MGGGNIVDVEQTGESPAPPPAGAVVSGWESGSGTSWEGMGELGVVSWVGCVSGGVSEKTSYKYSRSSGTGGGIASCEKNISSGAARPGLVGDICKN